MKKTTIALALMAASGVSQAATLNADSTYDISINTTGSCFALGDCTTLVDNVNPGAVISIATTDDGAGGVNFTVTSATDMEYTGTPFGLFTLSEIGGTGAVDADGNISYTPTGRLSYAQFIPYAGLVPWNINDTTAPDAEPGGYASLTSGSQTNFAFVDTDEDGVADSWVENLTLTGSALDDTLNATILSVSNVGTAWGSFVDAPYSEVWNITFTETAVVPVPAAVWLFGSGLVGLAGVARRRKAA